MKKLISLLIVGVFLLTLPVLVFGEDAPFARMMILVKTMDNPGWDSMIEGAKQAAKDLNLEMEALAPIKPYNVEEQIRFMEQSPYYLPERQQWHRHPL